MAPSDPRPPLPCYSATFLQGAMWRLGHGRRKGGWRLPVHRPLQPWVPHAEQLASVPT